MEFNINDIVHFSEDNVLHMFEQGEQNLKLMNKCHQAYFIKKINDNHLVLPEEGAYRITEVGILNKNYLGAEFNSEKIYCLSYLDGNKIYPGLGVYFPIEAFDEFYMDMEDVDWDLNDTYDISKDKHDDKPKNEFEKMIPQFKLVPKLVTIKEGSGLGRTSKNYYGFKINDNKAFIIKDDKLVIVDNIIGYKSLTNDQIITNIAKIKLKDYVKSSKIFGYGPTKKEMFDKGEYLKVSKISPDYVSKKNGETYQVLEVENNDLGKSLKVLLEDLSFEWPNLGGYNPPKDRSIKSITKDKYVNKTVRITNNRGLKVDKNTKAVVVEMYNTHKPCYGSHRSHNLMDTKFDRNTKLKLKVDNKTVICKIKNVKLIE